MAIETRNMRDPVTPLPYFEITADVGAPAAKTDPNVYTVAPADGSEEVEEQWQILGLAVGASNMEVIVTLWPYIEKAGLFFPMAQLEVVGVDKLSKSVGNVIDMPGILGCSAMGVQVDGLAGGESIRLVHTHR